LAGDGPQFSVHEGPARFDVLLFTDPQPESPVEVDFIHDDVVNGLIGADVAFGMTTGDIMFDDLLHYGRLNRIIGQIGVPWYNLGGNRTPNGKGPRSHPEPWRYRRHGQSRQLQRKGGAQLIRSAGAN
jgi:hypothetical protein